MNATASTTATWIVEYSDHDCGAKGGSMIRKTEKIANRTARLMRECGYQTVTVRQWTK